MCKIVAYMRVSTPEKNSKKEFVKKAQQEYERQKYILEHSGIKFDAIYEERISGGVRGDQRARFNEMIKTLDANDTVCFTESSRFGRNYIDCFDMLDIITQDVGANIKFLSNGFELQGGAKMNPYQWMTISQFFIQDEFLKRQIAFNTSNALKRKRELGVKLGAPVKIPQSQRDKVIELYKEGHSQNQISKILGISRTIVRKEILQKGV